MNISASIPFLLLAIIVSLAKGNVKQSVSTSAHGPDSQGTTHHQVKVPLDKTPEDSEKTPTDSPDKKDIEKTLANIRTKIEELKYELFETNKICNLNARFYRKQVAEKAQTLLAELMEIYNPKDSAKIEANLLNSRFKRNIAEKLKQQIEELKKFLKVVEEQNKNDCVNPCSEQSDKGTSQAELPCRCKCGSGGSGCGGCGCAQRTCGKTTTRIPTTTVSTTEKSICNTDCPCQGSCTECSNKCPTCDQCNNNNQPTCPCAHNNCDNKQVICPNVTILIKEAEKEITTTSMMPLHTAQQTKSATSTTTVGALFTVILAFTTL